MAKRNRLGFIVDGPGDFAAFRARFPDALVLKTGGPRGRYVSPSQMVPDARKQAGQLKSFGCKRAVIVCDFEDRTMDYDEFITQLSALVAYPASVIPVDVASPNRMLENWFLADIEELARKKKFLKRGCRQRNYEGRDGKKELKKLMRRGLDYNETNHGSELFPLVRNIVARTNSISFARFHTLVP